MTPDDIKEICRSLPGAWPDNPWEEEHGLFKVGPTERGKIFAFVYSDGVGVKAGDDRDEADEWLMRYPDDASVMAYIGRSGWNELVAGNAIPDDEIKEAIRESYLRVVEKLSKKHRPEGWDRV